MSAGSRALSARWSSAGARGALASSSMDSDAVWRRAWTPASVRLAPISRTPSPTRGRTASRRAPWTVRSSRWTCQPRYAVPSYAISSRKTRIAKPRPSFSSHRRSTPCARVPATTNASVPATTISLQQKLRDLDGVGRGTLAELLARIAVVTEGVDGGNEVEGDAVREVLRDDHLASGPGEGLLTEILDAMDAGARDGLVAGRDDAAQPAGVVQGLERHHGHDGRAVGGGDDAAVALRRFGVDLGHDEGDRRVHPEGVRLVHH